MSEKTVSQITDMTGAGGDRSTTPDLANLGTFEDATKLVQQLRDQDRSSNYRATLEPFPKIDFVGDDEPVVKLEPIPEGGRNLQKPTGNMEPVSEGPTGPRLTTVDGVTYRVVEEPDPNGLDVYKFRLEPHDPAADFKSLDAGFAPEAIAMPVVDGSDTSVLMPQHVGDDTSVKMPFGDDRIKNPIADGINIDDARVAFDLSYTDDFDSARAAFNDNYADIVDAVLAAADLRMNDAGSLGDAKADAEYEIRLGDALKQLDVTAAINDRGLSVGEQFDRVQLGQAILKGDTKAIEEIVRAHKNDPEALSKVLDAVSEDLKSAGVHISWQVGNLMMGDDTDFHPVGNLKIFREQGDKSVSICTDERITTSVGGPISWDKAGNPIDLNTGLSTDPSAVMKDIGSFGVNKLSPANFVEILSRWNS